jgi:hypothetical protein
MMRQVWITATPRVPATGATTTVRLAGGPGPYYRSSQHWRAGVVSEPRFTAELGFGEDGWTGGTVPATSNLTFMPADKTLLALLASYLWNDAAITVETGEPGASVTTVLTGTIAGAAIVDHALVLTIADLSRALDKPVLTARFAGTGGAEGGTEAAGRVKRRSWGRVFNVEGLVLDKANNVYEFGDPSFPWQQFDTLRDMGRDASPAPTVVTWQGSVAATLTALAASSPAQGSGVVAPSIACAKWWTQPAGPLTADVRGEVGTGYVETVPEIAERVVTAASGPTIANVSAMAALRSAAAGIHVGDENETAAQALDRLLLGVSLLWVLEPAGTIRFREWTFSSPVASLTSREVGRRRSFLPVKTRRVGYQQGYRVHSDGEIATILNTAGLVPLLTNESHTVAADSAGTVASFTGAGGTFKVFEAGVEVTTSATFSVVSSSGVTISINSSGVYTPTAMSADSGTATLRAVYSGITLDKVYSIAKSKAGATGATGTAGQSATVGYLTNEAHTIAADSAGTVASFTGSGGTFKVYSGTTDVTTSATFSVVSSSGVTISIGAATGIYSITAMSADTGTATLQAVYGGVTITKDYVISKARAGATGSTGSPGAAGAAAKTVMVISDRQNIVYDGTGALTPTTQTTTFTAQKQNTTNAVTWSMTDLAGNVLTASTYLSATTGDSVTMTAANFSAAIAVNSSTGVIVTGTISADSISDKISVVKVAAGAAGAAGATGPGGPVISLAADAEAFTYTDLVADNSSQTINFTATRQNTSETVNFTTSPSVTLTGGPGLTRAMTITAFGTNRQVVVTATGATSGATDTITVVRLEKSTAQANATATVDPATNANPQFLLYPTSTGLPTSWSNNAGMTTANVTRVAGLGGAVYAMDVTAAASTLTSFRQVAGSLVVSVVNASQYLLLEVDIRLVSGSLTRGQLRIEFYGSDGFLKGNNNLRFDVDKTTSDAVAGVGVAGSEYSWRKLIQAPAGSFYYWIFGDTAASYLGATDAREYIWRRLAVTPATDTDIKTYGQEAGADVTATAVPVHQLPASQTFTFNSDNTAKVNQLPRTLVVKRFKGATDMSQDNGTSWTATSPGATVTINNTNGSGVKGNITVSAIAANTYVEVTSTRDSVPIVDRIDLYRVKDDPASGGGSGATGFDANVSGTVTATSFAPGDVVATGSMRSSASGTVLFTLDAEYYASGSNKTGTGTTKIQKSLEGAASWSDISIGSATGTQASTADLSSGAVSIAGTATGLTASTDYDFRVVAYKAGTSTDLGFAGTFYGRQS